MCGMFGGSSRGSKLLIHLTEGWPSLSQGKVSSSIEPTPASPGKLGKSTWAINEGKAVATRSLTPIPSVMILEVRPLWGDWIMSMKALKNGIWVLMKTLKRMPLLSVRWSTIRQEEREPSENDHAGNFTTQTSSLHDLYEINLYRMHSLNGTS